MLRAGRRTLLIKIVARTKGGYGETVVKSTVRVKAIDSLMKEIRRARTLRISSLILNGPCLFFILTSWRFGPQSLETQRMPAKKSSWKAPSGIYWAILELRNTPPYIQQPKYHPSRALWHCAVALQWVEIEPTTLALGVHYSVFWSFGFPFCPACSEEFTTYGLKRKQAPAKVSHGKRLSNDELIYSCYRIILTMRLRKFRMIWRDCAGWLLARATNSKK